MKKNRFKRIKGVSYCILNEFYDNSNYKVYLLFLEGAAYPYSVYIEGVTKRFILTTESYYAALSTLRKRIVYMLIPTTV